MVVVMTGSSEEDVVMERRILIVVLAVVVVVATACASSKAEITTRVEGRFAIEEVELVDRFPPDCDPQSADCATVEPGYRILIVWLEAQDPDEVDDLSTAAPHLSLGDGTEIEYTAKGVQQGRYFVAFTPRAGAEAFTLRWADNPDIELGEYLGE